MVADRMRWRGIHEELDVVAEDALYGGPEGQREPKLQSVERCSRRSSLADEQTFSSA